jgi:hypothetical protein
MRGRRAADDSGMGKLADQPWMVLARRPAPLAGLFRSESERMRSDQPCVDDEGVDEGQNPLADVGRPPGPPATVD